MSRIKSFIVTIFVVLIIIFCEAVFNHPIDKLINGIFLIRINKNFEKTILGDLVYNTADNTRIWRLTIYNADNSVEKKLLVNVIDISTWKMSEFQESNSLNFEDKGHYYAIKSYDAGFGQEETLMNCYPK